MATPEQRAREIIDAQLNAAGWVVQSRGDMSVSAGLGVAVREYPLATGPCDYLLFGKHERGVVVAFAVEEYAGLTGVTMTVHPPAETKKKR